MIRWSQRRGRCNKRSRRRRMKTICFGRGSSRSSTRSTSWYSLATRSSGTDRSRDRAALQRKEAQATSTACPTTKSIRLRSRTSFLESKRSTALIAHFMLGLPRCVTFSETQNNAVIAKELLRAVKPIGIEAHWKLSGCAWKANRSNNSMPPRS